MKIKILLFFFLAVFNFTLFAGNISLEQEQKVALNFYFEKYNRFEGKVSIWIFDDEGKESLKILDEYFTKGRHKVARNLDNLTEGIYFCSVQYGNETITKKIIIVK
jgi:hypothetical protein